MIRKLLLAGLLLVLPLTVANSSPAAANCATWNAAGPDQHHPVGPIDVVGGHGYGSGFHDSAHRSPPQPMGAYGDPKRRGAQGGYIQGTVGKASFNVNLFGPFDETDTTHFYDTVFGACIAYNNRQVSTGEKCVATSKKRTPTQWGTWTPCGGY